MTENDKNERFRVILCKPGEYAEVVEIDDTLESMQHLVGGLSVSIILQNLAQLKELFGKQWESIVKRREDCLCSVFPHVIHYSVWGHLSS